MPELPEVETVRRGLAPAMEGKAFARVELRRTDLRRPFPKGLARTLTGRTVLALRRRAKYLVADLSGGDSLVMHLGMSGSFRVDAGEATSTPGVFRYERSNDAAHDHAVFTMTDGTRITYNDPRRFGSMDLLPTAGLDTRPPLGGLGLEPLGGELSARTLAGLLAGRRAPLKAALLDQRIVAGLGNIYVCEALWRSHLSPLREAGSIVRDGRPPSAEAKRLAGAIRAVLEEAVEAGGSSLRNHVRADGELGMFQHRFDVYDREGEVCHTRGCGGVVERVVQSGRSTFFCRTCQRQGAVR
ncbi:MAG: bifunctional DNA-formamidopyrimidine glycosylase/DNA-(apurinic or apyrimidinic site) lyase [Bauldia sp.]|nr:bifunctional DNA-formamidopyrimidine glycosylase/DNA-(apurinic or apyrimidinic site) lyase [Bauldia sp.]